MCTAMSRLSNITTMESKISKKDANATLWDCEEAALRFLLEDGKLNLCLRLLVDLKSFEREAIETGAEIKENDRNKLDEFERGVGTVLKNAWKHKEAIQTTDMPLLVEHVASVLKQAAKHSKELLAAGEGAAAANAQKQEALVMHYLYDVLRFMERDGISESRIMPLVKKNRIVKHLVQLLGGPGRPPILSPTDAMAGLVSLSIIFSTDDYSIHKAEYVKPTLRKSVIGLSDVIHGIVDGNREAKKSLRPLLDNIALFEMSDAK